jgi:hypothetical protein
MRATRARLLQSASEIVGGNKALAARLGIRASLLSRFIAGDAELPDRLLLVAVDIILAHRQAEPLPASQLPAQSPESDQT